MDLHKVFIVPSYKTDFFLIKMIKSAVIKVATLKNTDDGKISKQFDTTMWKDFY